MNRVRSGGGATLIRPLKILKKQHIDWRSLVNSSLIYPSSILRVSPKLLNYLLSSHHIDKDYS